MNIDNKQRDASWKDIAAEFQSERDALRGDVMRIAQERDVAIAEANALRQDAERYRWLLDYGKPALWHQCARMDSYDDVERAIDAAMEAK